MDRLHLALRAPARYTEAMSSLTQSSKWQQALAVFQLSEERFGRHLHSTTAALGVLRKAPRHRWPWAAQLLQRLHDGRIPLDVVCFSSLASSCEESTLWRKTLQILEDMQSHRISPNSVALTACLRALGRAGQWRKSKELVEWSRRCGLALDALAYVALSFAHEQSSRWQLALALPMHCQLGASGFGVALAACEKAQLWTQALHLQNQLQERSVDLNLLMLNSLLSTFSQAMKWTLALQLLQGGPDAVGLSAVLASCEEGGAPALPAHQLLAATRLSSRPPHKRPAERQWGAELMRIQELQNRGYDPKAAAFKRHALAPAIRRLGRPTGGQHVEICFSKAAPSSAFLRRRRTCWTLGSSPVKPLGRSWPMCPKRLANGPARHLRAVPACWVVCHKGQNAE
ncbi:unnamed protein product [Durusdinium trenchii]|uniref:Pentatricopeptide repeat-containing protein, chloroplastic n=2 Tax=Durusdinium trenchii TaxID=1381693 RepID=A0ABP0SJL6_9DINO